ncbi:hypothetical protein ACFLY8_05020 [Halobacteriota archaeon]
MPTRTVRSINIRNSHFHDLSRTPLDLKMPVKKTMRNNLKDSSIIGAQNMSSILYTGYDKLIIIATLVTTKKEMNIPQKGVSNKEL